MVLTCNVVLSINDKRVNYILIKLEKEKRRNNDKRPGPLGSGDSSLSTTKEHLPSGTNTLSAYFMHLGNRMVVNSNVVTMEISLEKLAN